MCEEGLAFGVACTRVSREQVKEAGGSKLPHRRMTMGLKNRVLSACFALGECRPIRFDGEFEAQTVHLLAAPRLVKVAPPVVPFPTTPRQTNTAKDPNSLVEEERPRQAKGRQEIA